MSDLRTRIAAVITDGVIAQRGHGDIADAVIAELKLRRETVGLLHRYVTNWKAADA
jgi:hypothetical protein